MIFDLSKRIDNNLKHEIYFIIKQNEVLAEHTVKERLDNYCPYIRMEVILTNMERSKTSELHKSVLNFSQKLELK